MDSLSGVFVGTGKPLTPGCWARTARPQEKNIVTHSTRRNTVQVHGLSVQEYFIHLGSTPLAAADKPSQ